MPSFLVLKCFAVCMRSRNLLLLLLILSIWLELAMAKIDSRTECLTL